MSTSANQGGYLPLPPLARRPPPTVQYPLSLLTFSYTADRVLEFGNSALRYFRQPQLNVSLNRGYDTWIKRPEELTRLDNLLRALQQPEAQLEARRADLVTWRGVMTKILTAPYEKREGWEMNIMMVQGIMYLEEHLTDTQVEDKESIPHDQRMMMYHGYSFESYCTTAEPTSGASPGDGWGGDVDTNIQWCSVVKSKIGEHRMILGAEIDCVRDKFTGQPHTFVELKASMVMRSENDHVRFRQKLVKFWAQSFLVGVPEIVVGFRTREGILKQVQTFETLKIPASVRGRTGEWDSGVALCFGVQCLTFLKTHVRAQQRTPDDERRVWRVRFDPRTGMHIRELGLNDILEVARGEDRVGFLPRFFVPDL